MHFLEIGIALIVVSISLWIAGGVHVLRRAGPQPKYPSLFCWLAIGLGTVLLIGGFVLFILFSPSPHGYLERFLALPIMTLGGLNISVSLLLEWKWSRLWMRILAIMLAGVGFWISLELASIFVK